MAKTDILNQIVSASPNRRSLLKKIGAATAAVTAAGTSGALRLEGDPATPSPIDVAQFALNLEYLEAEFYSIATTGQNLEQRGIDITGTGTSGPTTTSYGKVNFGNNLVFTGAVAQNIAADEIAHVKDIRAALMSNGITPVAKPAINLDALAPAGASLQNQQTFLVLARIFEDIGVTAYAGGAPFLASAPALLQAAARILAVEGEHVANIRLEVARLGISTPKLDGADVLPPPNGTNFFSTNIANGLVAIRTPGQVLYLAYGMKANATSGGFFPNGANGAIHTSTSAATAANLA
jgi:Ferritin-like domain